MPKQPIAQLTEDLNAKRRTRPITCSKGDVYRVSQVTKPTAPVEPLDVLDARTKAKDADTQVRMAKAALYAAERARSRATSNLHTVLVRHGLIATKLKKTTEKPLKNVPESPREAADIPSCRDEKPMSGMTKKVQPADRAIRDAREVIDQGRLRD